MGPGITTAQAAAHYRVNSLGFASYVILPARKVTLGAKYFKEFSNKSTYDPQSVIKYVDSSFVSNADDALFTFPDKDPSFSDYNFLGQSRNNFTNYRQTIFALNLMNGTDFGGVVDPRLTRMLSPSPDGQSYSVEGRAVS